MVRSAPQSGFALQTSRINAWTSGAIAGRPERCRLFRVQNTQKPCRCHEMTVVGLTICTVEHQPRHVCESHAQRMRSVTVKRGRGRRARFTTARFPPGRPFLDDGPR